MTTIEAGALGDEEVEVTVEYCGMCPSDPSIIGNERGTAGYPFIPGYKVIGTLSALGTHANGLRIGQRVGVGWTAESCMHGWARLSGDQSLRDHSVATIVQRCGGSATNAGFRGSPQ